MTTAAQLLANLQALGVTLASVGHRLRFHPRNKVTDELLQARRKHKIELLARTQHQDHAKPVSDALAENSPGKGSKELKALGADGAHGDDGDAGQELQPDSETTICCPWCSSLRLSALPHAQRAAGGSTGRTRPMVCTVRPARHTGEAA
jgi:hypothetical protein